MTNKEIYEKVLEVVDKHVLLRSSKGINSTYFTDELGVCSLISYYAFGNSSLYYWCINFPEWEAQKPNMQCENFLNYWDARTGISFTSSGYWWPLTDRQSRVEALKKAIAMCE